jgi:[acyl-carrier-protein] S-malonyltransferase
MRQELESIPLRPPRMTVYANVTAAPHADPASICDLLVQQIVRPVRWEQTMQTLTATEGLRFIELAPGRTLAGLAKKINRRLPIESLAAADSLKTGSSH